MNFAPTYRFLCVTQNSKYFLWNKNYRNGQNKPLRAVTGRNGSAGCCGVPLSTDNTGAPDAVQCRCYSDRVRTLSETKPYVYIWYNWICLEKVRKKEIQP